MRVVTIKCPPSAIDAVTEDSFHVGDVYDVSPNLGILLAAAGWVRNETRAEARRGGPSPSPWTHERRLLEDRRH